MFLRFARRCSLSTRTRRHVPYDQHLDVHAARGTTGFDRFGVREMERGLALKLMPLGRRKKCLFSSKSAGLELTLDVVNRGPEGVV